MALKRISWVSGGLVLLILIVYLFISLVGSRERASLLAQEDTRLVAFNYAQTLALETTALVTVSSADYQTLSQEMQPIMTPSLYSQYFPTASYQGGAKSVSVSLLSVGGQFAGPDQFLFKLDLNLTNGASQSPLVLLVQVNNGIITRIQSLG